MCLDSGLAGRDGDVERHYTPIMPRKETDVA